MEWDGVVCYRKKVHRTTITPREKVTPSASGLSVENKTHFLRLLVTAEMDKKKQKPTVEVIA